MHHRLGASNVMRQDDGVTLFIRGIISKIDINLRRHAQAALRRVYRKPSGSFGRRGERLSCFRKQPFRTFTGTAVGATSGTQS
jgi:hypothetical protein